MSQSLPRLLAIVGPTASGKTRLAITLAEALGGEIVGADSRQIYREMDIATAKPTPAERAQAPHHLIDFLRPDERYTLALYQHDAMATINAIIARGRVPLLVGGTGLYIRAITDGLVIPEVPPQPELRAQWETYAAEHGSEALYQILLERDPAAVQFIAATNVRRIVRALEVQEVTGTPFSHLQQKRPIPFALHIIGLNTDRALLYERADRRVDEMVTLGLVQEVERLVESGYNWSLPSMSGLGYRQIGQYLRGEMSLADAVQRLKFDTHDFIRRQLVWFRPDQRIHWYDCLDAQLGMNVLRDLS